MNWLNTFFIFLAAFLAVFWEAAFGGIRQLLGAQLDLLPPLMVYAGLCASFTTVCLLAVWGGILFDSLSANPLGISVLPLLLIGLALYTRRDVILRDQLFAQFFLGFAASAAVPALGLMLLLTTGRGPVVGWGTVWQLIVMSIGGAVVTPIAFIFFDWLKATFLHRPPDQLSFRPDREIRRGR